MNRTLCLALLGLVPSIALAQPKIVDANPLNAGAGTLNLTASFFYFNAFDGSRQAAVLSSANAVEYPTLYGSPVGVGATVRSDSATSVSPKLNLLAKGSGDLYLGNNNGTFLHLYNNPAASIVENAAITNQPTGIGVFFEAEGSDSTINVGLIPKGANGAILARKPDSTATGGNPAGATSIDLQTNRATAAQVASGAQSVILGGANNIASGTRAVVVGSFGSIMDAANAATIGGADANSSGRYGWHGYSLGIFSTQGDAQYGDQTLRGVSTAGAAVRLTGNALAADGTSGTRNCLYILPNYAHALRIELVANNITTAGHTSAYFNTALLAQGANAAATTLSLGTATTLGTDVQTVSLTADTSIGCVNATITPPNTDTWHYVLHAHGPEVK